MNAGAAIPYSTSYNPYRRARRSNKALSEVDRWGLLLTFVVLVFWASSFVLGFPFALKLLSLLGFAAAAFGIYKPAVGLLGVGLLCTLDALTRVYIMTGGLLRWNTFNYFLMLVAALYSWRLIRTRFAPLQIFWLLSGLLALGLLSSDNLASGLQHWLNLFSWSGLVVYFLRSSKDPKSWVWVGLFTGFTAAVGGLVFNLLRGSLSYINPNAFAYFPLTALFSICLCFKFAGQKRIQNILIGLALVNAGWVFLSSSRGSMLVALCCLLYMMVCFRNVSQHVVMAGLGVLLALGICTQFPSLQEFATGRIDKLFNTDHTLADRTSGRSDLVLGGWNIFCRHPLGVGTGSFSSRYAVESLHHGLSAAGESKAAHSAWIKILTENGLPGILLFSAYVFSFAWIGWWKRKEGLFLIGLLVSGILAVAFLSDEFQSKGIWFLAAGGMVVLYRGYRVAGSNPVRRDRARFTPHRPVAFPG